MYWQTSVPYVKLNLSPQWDNWIRPFSRYIDNHTRTQARGKLPLELMCLCIGFFFAPDNWMTVWMEYSATTSTGERARQRRWKEAGTPFGENSTIMWRQNCPYVSSQFDLPVNMAAELPQFAVTAYPPSNRDGKTPSPQPPENHCDGILPSTPHDGEIAVTWISATGHDGTFAVTFAWHHKWCRFCP